MKYGSWTVAVPRQADVTLLEQAGYSPLTARALCGRGCKTPEEAQLRLDAQSSLLDPFSLKEMDRAVAAVEKALSLGHKIAVFGDYDVDGITATCLLVDYLRSRGGDCVAHIPGRLEEGYGLNAAAIHQLCDEGVKLIITVDCGITALEEAELCRQLGIPLVITDHHECKKHLPQAAAVVDPHRPGRTYPHTDLSGVGVAFKLAAALDGDQEAIARRYCDLFCLGTIADVMPLRGENRRLVVMGLQDLQHPRRLGLQALIHACDCEKETITAGTIGYILAPRINAAGRMEYAELAVQLFLTEDADEARNLAETLCRLNRERQNTESEIYREALEQLQAQKVPDSAIVLAGENWHQGVVGIVASRLSEEFCRPTFLICLDGERGKASSRSYGGFNLFSGLTELSDLLEGYGGHELAAGFTILRSNIDEFRRRICQRAEAFAASGMARSSLEIDGEIPAAMLTPENVQGLAQLEPTGTCCPKPVFCITEAILEQATAVGGGKHLRLRLKGRDGSPLQAIFFSAGSMAQQLSPGQRLDLAFTPQINTYRGVSSVQLNIIDLRDPDPREFYERFLTAKDLSLFEQRALAPCRADVTDVWNYLLQAAPRGQSLLCQIPQFCQQVASFSRQGHSVRKTLACLDILAQLQLISLERQEDQLQLCIACGAPRNPLENSPLYRDLQALCDFDA